MAVQTARTERRARLMRSDTTKRVYALTKWRGDGAAVEVTDLRCRWDVTEEVGAIEQAAIKATLNGLIHQLRDEIGRLLITQPDQPPSAEEILRWLHRVEVGPWKTRSDTPDAKIEASRGWS